MNDLNQCEIPGVPPQKKWNDSHSGRNIYLWNINMSRLKGLKKEYLRKLKIEKKEKAKMRKIIK